MDCKQMKIGHHSQLNAVEEMRLCGGKGDGVRLVQVKNEDGLRATVCADRCLDLYRFEYKGHNLGFFSAAGYVNPTYYDEGYSGRNFTAGFLSTCGLLNVGAPSVDEGVEYGLHGKISNTPCENLAYNCDPISGKITISGNMREAELFGEKFLLSRNYIIEGKSVLVKDAILNEGGEAAPFLILYHCNFGYPLLDEGVELMFPSNKVIPRDAEAEKGIDVYDQIIAPEADWPEQCFMHDMPSKDGITAVALYNAKLGIGVKIEYSSDTLDQFGEWKSMRARDYALGLEPSNCSFQGRKAARDNGILKTINPGETKESFVKFTVFEADELDAVRAEINSYKK